MNENNMEDILKVSVQHLPHESVPETTPEQDMMAMKEAFANEKGINVKDVIEVNGHFIVNENATPVHTIDDGTVN